MYVYTFRKLKFIENLGDLFYIQETIAIVAYARVSRLKFRSANIEPYNKKQPYKTINCDFSDYVSKQSLD